MELPLPFGDGGILLLCEWFYRLGGDAAIDEIAGKVFGDDGTGGNDGIAVDGDTGADDGTGTDPDIGTDGNFFMDMLSDDGAVFHNEGTAEYFGTGGDGYIIADLDTAFGGEIDLRIDNEGVAAGDAFRA